MVASRYETRAWFLREEGNYLRPLYDYGTRHFVGLCARWEEFAPLPARRRFGKMLLTPAANCADSDEYATYFLQTAGDLACEALGRTECVKQIKSLARANPELHTAACTYLLGQQKATCE